MLKFQGDDIDKRYIAKFTLKNRYIAKFTKHLIAELPLLLRYIQGIQIKFRKYLTRSICKSTNNVRN